MVGIEASCKCGLPPEKHSYYVKNITSRKRSGGGDVTEHVNTRLPET